jgi:hypothetical protein
MEAYQERLIDEHTELAERVEKLQAFIHSPDFPKLSGIDQGYLQAQLPYMVGYLRVLSSRVAVMEIDSPPAGAADEYEDTEPDHK